MEQIAMSLGMAILLSLVTYMSKMQGGEAFDAYKALRTLLIGVVIGGIAYAKDYHINMENWESYLAANVGIIAMLDQGLKFIWRLFDNKNNKKELVS